jgi:hypothetical protein
MVTTSLWRHADFMKLWAGQTVSELGSVVTRGGAARQEGDGVADYPAPPGSSRIVETKVSTSRRDPEYFSTVGSVSGRQQAIA